MLVHILNSLIVSIIMLFILAICFHSPYKMATMDFAEIHVDQKYHRHIIGKGGASGMYSTHWSHALL